LTFSLQLFSRLKVTHPNYESRVSVVAGEMTEEGLGLSEEDKEAIRRDVSVVIHSAASVNFMEKLRDAVMVNVVALQEMVQFAKTLPKLEVSFNHPNQMDYCIA
jgi:fatty acyl-CoA reductase